MASLFHKEPTEVAPLTNIEKIESEIAHLQKHSGTRNKPGADPSKMTIWAVSILLCVLLALYLMDPFLYAMQRGNGIRAYLYLYNYGGVDNPSLAALVNAHIFTDDEIQAMNGRKGAFQDYFTSPTQAQDTAQSVVTYLNGVKQLHAGKYEALNPIGKLRCILFVRLGLIPPTSWKILNPTVGLPED